MVRQLGHMRLRILHVERLERLSGAPVQLDAPRRRQRVVNLPNQPVREAQAPASAWNWREHASRHSLVEHLEQLVQLKLAQPGEGIEHEFAAEHGSEREHACTPRREAAAAVRSPRQHLVECRSTRGRGYRRRPGRPRRRADVHDLANEEWIAFRFRVDRRDELCGSVSFRR